VRYEMNVTEMTASELFNANNESKLRRNALKM